MDLCHQLSEPNTITVSLSLNDKNEQVNSSKHGKTDGLETIRFPLIKQNKKVFIYSDKIGQGTLLQYNLPNHQITSLCSPGASFNVLVESMDVSNIDQHSQLFFIVLNNIYYTNYW